ncbi:MAG: thiamine pyrophosphate-binding protein [Micrococcales bacterium 70-64]|nr:thiamine pyrophosphate-binding protein [Leifsonia sp.]ODU64481.1 MAG: thiamine pyrophosphate-binding protein [Leifsonia sp. SCN 70-46]OJX86173.1 MAG: thiamine pyrophosphate-binding protein [Micrococcales bacterium 70-64]
MTSLSERIAESLSRSVSDVFGVMGNGNAHLLDALPRVGVRFTAMRHEAGGVAAADAYFRAAGRLAVATTTYGAGFTNALTPLAEAAQARIPLVLVTGDAPTDGARPWDVDQRALAEAVGARWITAALDDPGADRAVALARAERTAVVLAIPHDLVSADAVVEVARTEPVEVSPKDTSAALTLLRTARRPLVLAGRGAWLDGAGPALTTLADRLGALTATTALGAGLFGDSPHDLGIAGGFGSDAAAAVMRDADVVLVVGASLSQFTLRFGDLFGPDARLIQVDIEDSPAHPRVDEFVRGAARAAAEALVAGLPVASPPRWSEAPRGRAPRHTDDELAADGRLDPRALATALDGLLPADRTVVQDGGHFLGWAPSYWRIPAPNRLVMVGTAYQSIGLGFPSAVGAAVALPATTVVLCTGDGGGLMALADFETFVRTARSGVVVVFNDAAYGAELHQYGSLDHGAMLIPEVDFAGVGRSLGATAATVGSLADLAALELWSGEGVLVLDCRISREVVAPYLREWMHASHLD